MTDAESPSHIAPTIPRGYDNQVMYWEPKHVAKLPHSKTDSNALMLKTILEAGHLGASGRYDALKELAFTYAFVLDQLGLAK